MTTEFNLSEKIMQINHLNIISEEDVKDFIKLLKRKLFNIDASSKLFLEIDKLAGDKLI